MKHMKFAVRLGIGFGILLVFMVALAAVELTSMGRIQARLDSIVNENVHKNRLLNTMAESVHIVARVTRSVILLDEDAASREHEYTKIVDASARYDQAWAELQKLPASE